MSEHVLSKELRKLKKFNLIAVFGGLTTVPELQANQFTLEYIIHEVITMAGGHKPVRTEHIIQIFQEYDSIVGHYCDPAEGLFVSTVEFQERNYTLFEGLWEGNAFYLQRFLDIIDSMPNTGNYLIIKQSVYALLKLSDEVVKRSNLSRNVIGSEPPADYLSKSTVKCLKNIKERVIFTKKDFDDLGITIKEIIPFIMKNDTLAEITTEDIGNSELEKKPILSNGGEFALVLPSAISPAIRRFIIDYCIFTGSVNTLQLGLINSYYNYLTSEYIFRNLPIFPLDSFEKASTLFGAATEILPGRYLHFLFVVDDFSGYENGGLMSSTEHSDEIDKIITSAINSTQEELMENDHFRDGITLVITCSWGRLRVFGYSPDEREQWINTNIELKDLITLGLQQGVDTKRFWKFLQSLKFMDENNVANFNLFGLLNNYIYAEQQGGHFFDHAQMAEEGLNADGLLIMQTSNLQLARHAAAIGYDEHIQTDESDEVVRVSRLSSNTYFDDNKDIPAYGSITHAKQKEVKCVYEARLIDIWFKISNVPAVGVDFITICNACSYWIHKSINFIERHTVDRDKKKRVVWELNFNPAPFSDFALSHEKLDYKDLKGLVRSTNADNKIVVNFDEKFIHGFLDEGNEAEKCMLWTLLIGLRELQLIDNCDSDELVNEIVTSKYEKQLHLLASNSYEHFISKPLNEAIYIDIFDNSLHCLGLAWGVIEERVATAIVGKQEAVSFINKVVAKVFSELQTQLKSFDLRQLIVKLAHNLIAVKQNEERWSSTQIAIHATHSNKENVQHVIDEERKIIKSASLATRLLIEIALCECKEGVAEPDEIDISSMMTRAVSLFEVGGWSDALLYDLIPAEVRVSCLGNVLLNFDNVDKIVKPYSDKLDHEAQQSEMSSYHEYFEASTVEEEPQKNFDELIDENFAKAWFAEFGFTLESMFLLFNCLQQYCSEIDEYLLEITKTDLIKLLSEKTDVTEEEIVSMIESFVFLPRKSLDTTPDGYTKSDWHPWKFTRRLSILSKPIFQLNNTVDPVIIIVPNLIRGAIPYFIDKVYRAQFEARSFHSEEMIKWNGDRRSHDGHEFNITVRDKFIQEGWSAEAEVKLTKVLKTKLDKDFGDIDVLAWSSASKRALLVECKKLHFAKTYGDVAIQLDDFRGRIKDNGKPDRLLKHIQRCNVIVENHEKLAEYIGIAGEIKIEKCILFSGDVPMMYSEDEIFNEYIRLSYHDIGNL